MALHTGRLDRRVKLESLIPTQTPSGQTKPSWVLLATDVPANVRPISAREQFTADQVAAQFDSVFTIRFRDDVNQKDRLTYNDKVYDITGLREIGRRRWLELMAKARK